MIFENVFAIIYTDSSKSIDFLIKNNDFWMEKQWILSEKYTMFVLYVFPAARLAVKKSAASAASPHGFSSRDQVGC